MSRRTIPYSKRKLLVAIRWLALLPCCVIAWYLIFFIGLISLGGLVSLCPEEQMISGLCHATWYRVTENLFIALFAGVSSSVVLLVAFFLAPLHRLGVTCLTLIVGIGAALVFAIELEEWLSLFSVLMFGTTTAALLIKADRLDRESQSPNCAD